MKYWLILLAIPFSLALATDSEAPVPYRWGVFNPPKAEGQKKPILVAWNSPEGKRRLASSRFSEDFYQLASHYQPQLTPVYAGVASLVIVMNALRLPLHQIKSQKESEIVKPPALGGGVIPFPAYNQINFFNAATDAVKDRKVLGLQNANTQNENDKGAFKPGTSLAELKALLAVYGFQGEVTEATLAPSKGATLFREVLKKTFSESERFLLANFKGDEMGATTEGTVSPLVAFDAKSDSVLVLDVTAHKNPWYWAPVEAFYRSMHTQYNEGTWRGWIVVTR